VWGVAGLLLLNVALVAWLWVAPHLAARLARPTLPTAGASFLADTLHFSAAQRVRYDSLRARYDRQARPLAQECRQSCQQYFALLDSTLTDAQLADRSRAALASKVAVDVLTVRHLQQVAALCTPAQRTLLQRLLAQTPGEGCAAPGGGNAECLTPLNQ
jgi:Spy/CpxP family protein refolding chaperone